MEQLTYLLASVVAFLGIVAGAIIGYFAREELKAGRKYFIIVQKILLAAILAVFINVFELHIGLKIALYVLIIGVLSMGVLKSYFAYPALAVIFFLSSKSPLFATEAILIMLYGFPTGSLLLNKKENIFSQLAKIKLKHASFLVIALALFALTKNI